MRANWISICRAATFIAAFAIFLTLASVCSAQEEKRQCPPVPAGYERTVLNSPDRKVMKEAMEPAHRAWSTKPLYLDVFLGSDNSKEYYDAFEQWLKSQRFTIIGKNTEKGGDEICAKGTMVTAENAFATEMNESADGKWYANTCRPAVPARFKDITIANLNNLQDYGVHRNFKTFCEQIAAWKQEREVKRRRSLGAASP